MEFLKGALKSMTIGAVIGLALVTTIQNRELKEARREAGLWKTAAESATTAYREKQVEAERLDVALSARREDLARMDNERRTLDKRLAEEARHNATVRDWLDSPLPDAVRGMFAGS